MEASPIIYIFIYILTLLLAITEILPVSVASMLGALLMAWFGLNYGLFTYEEAISFIDLQLLMLLIGVMIVVEVANRSGIFRILGLYAIRLVGGSPTKLFFIISILSAASSLFLSDSAAVLIVSAIALTISRYLEYNPVPYVVAAAIMINLGGTGTLIGSVSNMIIGLNAGFSFMEFSQYLLPCELLLWFITTGVLYLYYRGELKGVGRRLEYDVWRSIEDRTALYWSSLLLLTMITLFIFSDSIRVGIEAIATGLAVIALATSRYDPGEILSRIDWETIFFVASFLFIIRGLEKTGILSRFARAIVGIAHGDPILAAVYILAISGATSIVMANVAVALTFTSAVKLMNLADKRAVWSALVLGTNLGGATLPVSSIVLMMALGALKHEGIIVDLSELTRVGVITSLIQLCFAALYLIIAFGLVY